jgi:excinuclease UvrABC nuclease subunit
MSGTEGKDIKTEEASRINNVLKISEDFKKLIKTLPLGQRGQALGIFNIFQKCAKLQHCNDTECEDNEKTCLQTESESIGQCDQIIGGERKANESEMATLKEFLTNDQKPSDSDNDQKCLEAFWYKCMAHKKMDIAPQDVPILQHLTRIERFSQTGKDSQDVLQKIFTHL